MAVDVLVLSLVVLVWWRVRLLTRPMLDPRLMPIEDRPPTVSYVLPSWLGRRQYAPVARYALRGYVGNGLAELEDYLAS